jgi:hypothetical protein
MVAKEGKEVEGREVKADAKCEAKCVHGRHLMRSALRVTRDRFEAQQSVILAQGSLLREIRWSKGGGDGGGAGGGVPSDGQCRRLCLRDMGLWIVVGGSMGPNP